jgi:iron complex transport system substrate-binding protein
MRIVSLLPSATEILFALGLCDSVVGVSHECDFPAQARSRRVVIRSRIPHDAAPGEVDRLVREFVARGESLYSVDGDALRELAPDVIVTQDLCQVCAASPDDLADALSSLRPQPQIISLNPHNLADVCKDILTIGDATDRADAARELVTQFEARISAVSDAVAGITARPKVVCLEWLVPFYVGGHWVPEMVERAGAQEVLARANHRSFSVPVEDVIAAAPDVILVMPCGYDADQAAAEYRAMQFPPEWSAVPAVRGASVFALDANGYFSRPGPRLADGVETLAHILHPQSISIQIPAGRIRRITNTRAATVAKHATP